MKALRQRKVSPFTDNRCWDDRSLGAAKGCEQFLPTTWSLLNPARCAGDRCTGQKLSLVHSESSVLARYLVPSATIHRSKVYSESVGGTHRIAIMVT